VQLILLKAQFEPRNQRVDVTSPIALVHCGATPRTPFPAPHGA
jgi:hypothetical protein